MEADESYSSEEAQPPSCLAPNANGGQDASPLYGLKGLAEGFSYDTSFDSYSFERTSINRVFEGYSVNPDFCITYGIPVRFVEQSSLNIKGGEQ